MEHRRPHHYLNQSQNSAIELDIAKYLGRLPVKRDSGKSACALWMILVTPSSRARWINGAR
jgi:hypothetical protein